MMIKKTFLVASLSILSVSAFSQDASMTPSEREVRKTNYQSQVDNKVDRSDQDKAQVNELREARELKKKEYLRNQATSKSESTTNVEERKAAREARIRRFESTKSPENK